jgi:hypothetical protein
MNDISDAFEWCNGFVCQDFGKDGIPTQRQVGFGDLNIAWSS